MYPFIKLQKGKQKCLSSVELQLLHCKFCVVIAIISSFNVCFFFTKVFSKMQTLKTFTNMVFEPDFLNSLCTRTEILMHQYTSKQQLHYISEFIVPIFTFITSGSRSHRAWGSLHSYWYLLLPDILLILTSNPNRNQYSQLQILFTIYQNQFAFMEQLQGQPRKCYTKKFVAFVQVNKCPDNIFLNETMMDFPFTYMPCTPYRETHICKTSHCPHTMMLQSCNQYVENKYTT